MNPTVGIRYADHATPLSAKVGTNITDSGGRTLGIACWPTKATEFNRSSSSSRRIFVEYRTTGNDPSEPCNSRTNDDTFQCYVAQVVTLCYIRRFPSTVQQNKTTCLSNAFKLVKCCWLIKMLTTIITKPVYRDILIILSNSTAKASPHAFLWATGSIPSSETYAKLYQSN
jgi:hypothetical protein